MTRTHAHAHTQKFIYSKLLIRTLILDSKGRRLTERWDGKPPHLTNNGEVSFYERFDFN